MVDDLAYGEHTVRIESNDSGWVYLDKVMWYHY